MKKLFQILAFAAILVSCSKDETVPVQGTYTLTGYTNVETKTDFGTPTGNTIPFEWSAGDFIWNGLSKSNLLTAGGSSATFTISGSEPAGTVYYNMTASNVREATTVKIPTEQDASKTLGENGDFGYATVENDGSFILKHATAYLWFDIEGLPSGSTLKSIRLHAGNTCVAGTAKFSSNKLNIVEGSGRSIVDLSTDISSVTNNADAVMVLCPAVLTNATITYQLTKGSSTEDYLYYEQTFSGKQLKAGVTSKISINLANVQLQENVIRTLTFEDIETKFAPFEFDFFVSNGVDYPIQKWSDLIDESQHNGDLLGYGMQNNSWIIQDEESHYNWCDDNNTFIAHEMPENYGGQYCFFGGGQALSHYATFNYVRYGDYTAQLTVFKEGADDMETYGGGHNGSNNFVVHYGYADYYNTGMGMENLPSIYFKDGISRKVDHIWVNNTTYGLYCFNYGNGLTENIGENDTVCVEAKGFDENDDETATATFYLVNGPDNVIMQWTKWDLSALGKVVRVEFNVIGTSDNGYGFSQPAYFAYDDVAVVFE